MRNIFKPKPAKSIKHALLRGATRAIIVTGTFFAAYSVAGGGGTQVVFPEAPNAPHVETVKPVDIIPAGADCDIEGVFPTGAVIKVEGKDAYYTTNPKQVALAFDFAIATMMKVEPKAQRITGVTLCLDKPLDRKA